MIRREERRTPRRNWQAGNRGWVPHSAAIECVPPFAAQSEPRTRWLAPDEFPKLLAALDTAEWMAKRVSDLEPHEAERKLREHGEHIADCQLFVTVACCTGVERSAPSRLDWTDVDFVAGRIRILGTKNATRDRTIDLDPQFAAALWRAPPGRRIGPVLRPWANACIDLRVAYKQARGIERRETPHTFRHTFGSWLVQAGVDTLVVGKRWGPQRQQDGRIRLRELGSFGQRIKSPGGQPLMVIQGRGFTGLCRAPARASAACAHPCARRNPTTRPTDPRPPSASIPQVAGSASWTWADRRDPRDVVTWDDKEIVG